VGLQKKSLRGIKIMKRLFLFFVFGLSFGLCSLDGGVKDEPILIELKRVGAKIDIRINNEKFSVSEAIQWLAELKSSFGVDAFLDIHCNRGVTVEDAMLFLTGIRGWEWPNLEVRSVPPVDTSWSEFQTALMKRPFLKMAPAKSSVIFRKRQDD